MVIPRASDANRRSALNSGVSRTWNWEPQLVVWMRLFFWDFSTAASARSRQSLIALNDLRVDDVGLLLNGGQPTDAFHSQSEPCFLAVVVGRRHLEFLRGVCTVQFA